SSVAGASPHLAHTAWTNRLSRKEPQGTSFSIGYVAPRSLALSWVKYSDMLSWPCARFAQCAQFRHWLDSGPWPTSASLETFKSVLPLRGFLAPVGSHTVGANDGFDIGRTRTKVLGCQSWNKKSTQREV